MRPRAGLDSFGEEKINGYCIHIHIYTSSLSVCLSIYLSMYLSVCLSIYLSLFLSLHTCYLSLSLSLSLYIYIYIYTGCPRRKGPNFGRVFLRSNYTDITQNTYIQSSMVTEILTREKCGLLWCLHTVPCP